MASTSTAEKAAWREGDSCLAPNPRDGILQEATIRRLSSTSNSNDTTAWVIFTDNNKNAEEEKEEEVEAIPVSKLTRSDPNHVTQEKPVFPSSVTDPRLRVPLVLSDADGDRVPYTINRYLRDYQREGIRFIYSNYIRSSGCILGDDMGLGKTVQVIGFLAAVLHKTGTWEDIKNNRPQFLQSQIPSKQSKPNKVFLIVAPLSVLYNWKDELDTWGHFQCVVVHGLRKEEELARIKKGRIEIALTTYETLRLCLDQFNNIDWSAVVVDEAHKIKNPSSQITQAMKELKCKIRIGLTGTILQNNLEELWCVMDWAIPGCLGNLGHFKNKFSDPIEQGQRHSATKRALATGRKTVRALVRKISHWFLRRTKALIREQLPKKNDRVVYCSLTDFQQTVYQTVLDTEDVTLLLRSSEKCGCQSGRTRRSCCYKANSEGVQIKELYFSYLAILRKVANHVALLQSTAGTSKKQEKYVSAVCQKVFQKFPDFVQRCKDEAFEALSDPMYSGKMKVLQKLLKYYLRKRDKVLLFSLSTKLLDVLESYCMAEGLDYKRLDGATKSKERVQIVKDFNSSSHINLCLVSTMAGGLGLNFVGANVVVLFDPTWNPANDLQAIDRAYRIGQCRDVTVLRLISLGTVEEVIYLRQVYKQQLQCSVIGKESSRRYFEAVQGHGVHKGELYGIKNLFRLQTQGTCLTRKILEEVVYTHSNQRVVGGSKAEEMISRAAVRHVFERKMYSQLPANHFLGTLEVLTSQKIFLSSLSNTFFGRGLFFILIFVFVSFSVLVCRQHLEEMAEKFKCPSVHQFAVEILSRNSSQRLAWLRQYYTSLNYPDLANTVTKHFPHSDSAQTSSTSAASSSTSTKTAATKSHTETRTPQKDVAKATRKPKYTQKNLGPKPQPEILQNHVPQTNPKNPQNDVLEPQKKQKISQKNALEPPSNVSSPESEGQEETVCNTPSSPDLSHGRSTMSSKPAAQGKEREQESSSRIKETFQGQRENSRTPSPPQQAPSTSSNRSFLTDLIGDTSILDDLITLSTDSGLLDSLSSPSSHTSTTHQVSTPVQASKGGRKDFWDILNEGNEESINRLTDPAEVQRVCVNTNFLARSRSEEEESKSLWKTNEKFLWKK
uniref:Excision repair cross-complementation group 6-like 2 n=1 Tax=Lates calcarifer TaxID=8187 RepID=A0A4W6CKF6_LATCA